MLNLVLHIDQLDVTAFLHGEIKVDHRSTSEHLLFYGDGTVNWASWKQACSHLLKQNMCLLDKPDKNLYGYINYY